MARTTKASLTAQGKSAFARALRSLGHGVLEGSKHGHDDFIVTVDGIEVPVAITAASVINPGTVDRMVATSPKRSGKSAHVAVGDLITGAAQDALREAGWGWFDRRGHVVLRAKGVHVDADVPTDERSAPSTPRQPISGAAAISWAAALLMAPEDPPSMREVGRRVSLSHSAIVAASKKLTASSLLRSDGRPLVPELFWALADAWHPRPVALAALPAPGEAGQSASLGFADAGGGPGWAVSGTVGAAAWGAPLAIGSVYPPDFYVPSPVELRQAALRCGEASRFEDRACTVAVAPTPLVCAELFRRKRSEWEHWRFAHGVFAALDLAQDRARGREILADWDPKDFARVW